MFKDIRNRIRCLIIGFIIPLILHIIHKSYLGSAYMQSALRRFIDPFIRLKLRYEKFAC